MTAPSPEPSSGPVARFGVTAVARRLGVAPATLRTWARRYGLGPTGHAAGAHRRYTADDLARLTEMRRLTLEGVPPAEAAHLALHGTTSPPRSGPGGPGGPVLALPGASNAARGLGRAALALDAPAMTRLVRAQLQQHGVVHTWEHVLRPVLAATGERWATTARGVEIEHLLSECVTGAVLELAHAAPLPPRAALLACAPGELHVLPVHVLAAALAEHDVGVRTLGAAVPVEALHDAVRRTGPPLVFLWSQDPATADADAFRALPTTRPRARFVAGGPGWSPAALPDDVTFVPDLPAAIELAVAVLHV